MLSLSVIITYQVTNLLQIASLSWNTRSELGLRIAVTCIQNLKAHRFPESTIVLAHNTAQPMFRPRPLVRKASLSVVWRLTGSIRTRSPSLTTSIFTFAAEFVFNGAGWPRPLPTYTYFGLLRSVWSLLKFPWRVKWNEEFSSACDTTETLDFSAVWLFGAGIQDPSSRSMSRRRLSASSCSRACGGRYSSTSRRGIGRDDIAICVLSSQSITFLLPFDLKFDRGLLQACEGASPIIAPVDLPWRFWGSRRWNTCPSVTS